MDVLVRWRAGVLVAVVLASIASPARAEKLNPQTELFYNARLALGEQNPSEVLKLWLLSNSVKYNVGETPAPFEGDFQSVVWAALGQLGLCQDGFAKDDGGAGLWPLGMHNYLARTAARDSPPDIDPPFGAFEVGRQQRLVSLLDVLSLEELRSVEFVRTSCLWPRKAMLQMGGSISAAVFPNLSDRLVTARLLRSLLQTSLQTLTFDKFTGVSVIEARLFDLDLVISQLQGQRARKQGLEAKQMARNLGVSTSAAQEVLASRAHWEGKEAAFLRRSLRWTADEWLALSRPRRLFLFAQARALVGPKADVTPLVLSVIDGLIARGMIDEVQTWIANLQADKVLERRELLFGGERGKRLLSLQPTEGFHERATVALHRGVAFLEAGQQQDALRSFAYAMANADDSAAAEDNRKLARRWLSFVMSRYQTTDELLSSLQALVPRQEWNALVEDLIWKAALRADQPSFDRAAASIRRGSALDERILTLRPLAQGNAAAVMNQVRLHVATEPHLALRFLAQLLDHLEAEDKDVRQAHIPTLKLCVALLESFEATLRKSNMRTAQELVVRAHALLGGLGVTDDSVAGKARNLSLEKQTFTGNVRLAPVDPLPWPFVSEQVQAPTVFAPLSLVPVQWRDKRNNLVFGWKLSE